MTNYVVMLDSGSGAGMTRVCKAGMTKEGYARFRVKPGMTFNTIVMADLIRHLDSGSGAGMTQES